MDYQILKHSQAVITQAVAEHAIEAASSVLLTKHLDPTRYKALVDSIDGAYRVGFIDKDVDTEAGFGNPSKLPALQIRLDPKTFKIVNIGLMR